MQPARRKTRYEVLLLLVLWLGTYDQCADDRRNVVRRVPKLASEGSVLFEAGTLSTRAGSLENSPIFESADEEEHADTSSSSSSEDSSYPATREFISPPTAPSPRC